MKKLIHSNLKVNKSKYFFVLLILLFLSGVNQSFASNLDKKVAVTQLIKQQRVSINLKNKSLKSIIFEIQRQSKIQFVLKDDVEMQTEMSINVTNKTVEETLNILFKNTNYTYDVIDNIVTILKREITPQPKANQKKLLSVKGKVVGKDKEPIIAATVIVKETLKGAITDAKGEFVLLAKPGDIIEVTYVGMETLSHKLAKSDEKLVLTLLEDALAVEDVIVTGFQNIRQHENVGAVSKVKGSELNINSTLSLEQMLEGKVAGMVISNPSGAVGQRQKTRIRGTSSLLGNQEPVWVVDGVIQEDPLPFNTQDFNSIADGSGDGSDMMNDFVGNAISWLNPNDIEDITVLKDAASTVLYGVKAANGVIVIRTKQGKIGNRASVSYAGGLTYKAPYSYDKLHMMNSKERIDVEREMVESGRPTVGVVAPFGYEYLYNLYSNKVIDFNQFELEVAKLETENTDWLGILTQGSFSHDHSINISGGTSRLTYYSSVNFGENVGEIRNNSSKKFGFNINVTNWLIENKLSLSMAVRGAKTDTEGIAGVNTFSYAKETSRSMPAYHENGERFFYENSNKFLYNMEHEVDNRANTNTLGVMNGSFNLKWDVTRGLKFDNSFSFGYQSTVAQSYATEYSNYITDIRDFEHGTLLPTSEKYKQSQLPNGGEIRTSENTNMNWSYRSTLSYNKVIDKSRFGGMIGFEMRSTEYRGFDSSNYGYMPDKGLSFATVPLQILNGTGDKLIENSMYDRIRSTLTSRLNNTLGAYVNASYSYDERYIVTASIRSDASNRFGQRSNEAFLPVYSIGGRWNLSYEPWMENINHIFNNVAFKGSFGYQGNVAENYGPDLIAKYGSNGDVNSSFGVFPINIVSLPYEDLTWEKTRTYNLGLDLGLFKNLIQVGFNYYKKKTTDVITNATVAYEYGISSLPVNDGTISNSGWDISVSATPIRTKDFVWNVSMNHAVNYNEVKSEVEVIEDWKLATSGGLVKDGYPISTVWGFKYEGVDGKTGFPIIKYKGEDDGNYDPKDVTTWLYNMGTLDPIMSGGFSTSFRYKTLTLSTSFSFQLGAGRWLSNYMPTTSLSPRDNLRSEALDRWRNPGDENRPGVMPGLPYLDNWDSQEKELPLNEGVTESENLYHLFNKSDVRFADASYFKCNSIRIGYTVPPRLLESFSIQTIGISFSLSNPFKITSGDFKDIDPEVAFGGLPLSRTLSFSLNIGF